MKQTLLMRKIQYRSTVDSNGTMEKQSKLPAGRKLVQPAPLLNRLYYGIFTLIENTNLSHKCK